MLVEKCARMREVKRTKLCVSQDLGMPANLTSHRGHTWPLI